MGQRVVTAYEVFEPFTFPTLSFKHTRDTERVASRKSIVCTIGEGVHSLILVTQSA
ncbi:MAG: hypothetical protein N2691_02480 [Patescibacteria group bacterium]|nr:hypothetical protein [Patescibacteria group bacterium]